MSDRGFALAVARRVIDRLHLTTVPAGSTRDELRTLAVALIAAEDECEKLRPIVARTAPAAEYAIATLPLQGDPRAPDGFGLAHVDRSKSAIRQLSWLAQEAAAVMPDKGQS